MIIYQKSKYFSAEQAQDNLTGLSPLLVRALRARGAVTPEQIERFLHPSAEDFHDPFLLPDMDKAVQRIHAALENGERICIFGDYDVDGICSTAMLVDYFHSVGAEPVSLTLPLQDEPFKSPYLFPAFANLLTEGENRQVQSQLLRIDPEDDFGIMLSTCGFDTVGAITVKPIEQ